MTDDPTTLPFRELIRPHTGVVTGFRRAETVGWTDFAGVVTCEKGPFFVKAMRNEGWRCASINRERLITPFLAPLAPTLHWDAGDDEWIALGLDVVDGRTPDFGPDSPDLPAVVELVDRIGSIELPEPALTWTETRWDRFVTRESERELFRGDTLLHADLNPYNLLIEANGIRALDWGWPTRGAGLIDPAMLVVQLIASGHTPAGAESWVSGCAAWRDASPEAVDAFAAAYLRMRHEMTERKPHVAARQAMLTATAAWAAHRGLTPS
ncbi:phosphotransferase [Streptomyces radicis]|uniref:phosphotransferase n=1 Tax=Streptomyces radicis TaxID=1750517 RepID=UPI0016016F10|nr:phosphotransferase [Streptomyces radicis]